MMLIENIPLISKDDCIFASYPSSGNAFLGALFLSLSLPYIDGCSEKLHGIFGVSTTIIDKEMYYRIPRFQKKSARKTDERYRIIKTHMYPIEIPASYSKVLILIRDGRDAIQSYFRWRTQFSNSYHGESFSDFLSQEGYYGKKPTDDWIDYYDSWLNVLPQNRTYVLRFEDLKKNTMCELRKVLFFLDVDCSDVECNNAIESSTLEYLRKCENESIEKYKLQKKTIFPSGKIGEWVNTFRSEDLHSIDNRFIAALKRFGYGT